MLTSGLTLCSPDAAAVLEALPILVEGGAAAARQGFDPGVVCLAQEGLGLPGGVHRFDPRVGEQGVLQ